MASQRGLLNGVCWLLGSLSLLLFAMAVLEQRQLAGAYCSAPSWEQFVKANGARRVAADFDVAEIPLYAPVFAGLWALSAVGWVVGAGWISLRRKMRFREALTAWGVAGWRWLLMLGGWWLLWEPGAFLLPGVVAQWLAETSPLWLVIALAGFATEFLNLAAPAIEQSGASVNEPLGRVSRRSILVLVLAMCVYMAVFTAMNAGLWYNLRLPHGDSAMYEEHLWNLEHGKGFRSYLDNNLFLGEHIQVIHVLLVPVHLLAQYTVVPPHLALEFCETLALALGAVPVFSIARRHARCERVACLLAFAYLLYVPTQFLDIAIDLKTFRPIAFGVPLLLWGLERMEAGRYRQMALLMVLALSAKEDYSIVLACCGVWMFLSARSADEPRRRAIAGGVLAIAGAIYLALAVKVVIPWFRGGDPHYARYFAAFGETPVEIVTNMVTRPQLLWNELGTLASVLYVLRVLAPIGFLPVLAPRRFLVGVPLLVLLCLNDLAVDPPAPVHHFHAPLIPILFWAAASTLAPSRRELRTPQPDHRHRSRALSRARFACACALLTGVTMSISPLGWQFWDAGSGVHWRTLYVPGERAAQFAKLEGVLPTSARVASTDFVHPRFTHYERSYDYSAYRPIVPDDTDYIVIDVEHPYRSPADVAALRANPHLAVRELREEPDRWELMPDQTDGYFLVLQRK